MEQMKAREVLHLVPLQMTDEVPAERQLENVHLLQCFLNAVLTDVPEACIPRGLQRIRSVVLGHRDDRHRLPVTTALSCCVDPLPHLPNPRRQVEERHEAATYR